MRSSFRLFLAASLLSLCAAAPAHHVLLAAMPISRMDEPWWRARFEAKQEELRNGRIDLVFFGDSITQNYETSGPPAWRAFAPIWQRFYGDRHAANLGFTGDADGLMRPYDATSNVTSPGVPGFAQQNFDYFVWLGDTIYETASGSTTTDNVSPAVPSSSVAANLTDHEAQGLVDVGDLPEGAGFRLTDRLADRPCTWAREDS